MPAHDRIVTAAVAVALAASLAVASPATAQAVELIPREVFFGNPDRAQVRVSPDGEQLAYLAPNRGVLNVWVERLDGSESRPVTLVTGRPIRTYQWAENGRQIIYLRDQGGNENFVVFAVDLDTGAERSLTPTEGVQARLVATDRQFPDEILVALNDRVPQMHDVYRVNTRTGERRPVFRNERGFVSMIADHDFRIRVATRYAAGGGMRAYMRDDESSGWYELARWGLEDAAVSGPISLDRDGRSIYLLDSRRSDTAGLHVFVPPDAESDGRYERLASRQRTDVADVIFHPVTGAPQAVAFDHARREWQVLDPAIEADWAVLTRVADGEMDLVSRDNADVTWVVSYRRDDGPVEYYRYDRRRREAELLFTNRSALLGRTLAKMRPVQIPARDGLQLVSYLTTPPQRSPIGLPTVLLVHGGPWARDSWGYNPLHQWLANRGYAVLSVNFRGSTGFGKGFLNAGNYEWSRRMHDDLIDAVNWAVSEGVADPDRVAIMGGSYGGYATLVGLTFTPDFFAAGVDIVGPSHVRTLLESIPPYWEPMRAL
ncbi:MAG: S9 family peptidase, partial [Planctomycetota bacterium]